MHLAPISSNYFRILFWKITPHYSVDRNWRSQGYLSTSLFCWQWLKVTWVASFCWQWLKITRVTSVTHSEFCCTSLFCWQWLKITGLPQYLILLTVTEDHRGYLSTSFCWQWLKITGLPQYLIILLTVTEDHRVTSVPHCSEFCLMKWSSQRFVMVDFVREITAKKYKYGKFRFLSIALLVCVCLGFHSAPLRFFCVFLWQSLCDRLAGIHVIGKIGIQLYLFRLRLSP